MSAVPSRDPHIPMPRGRAIVVASGLMILAGLLSSLMHIGVRYVAPTLPNPEIVFLRTLFTLIATLPLVLASGSRAAWRTTQPRLQIWRALIGGLSVATWYYALANMPLADAGALSFTTGIFVTIGAAIYFSEPVGLRRWSAVIVGLIGALIVIRPGSGVITLAAFIAVLSSALWAASLLMAKELAKTDSPLTIVFYNPLLICPMALVASLPTWVWPDATVLAITAGMGVFAAFGNYLYVQALRTADASVCMPADYVRLVWMVSWGYFIFAEVPSLATWVGSALIIASTAFITWREQQLANLRHQHPSGT